MPKKKTDLPPKAELAPLTRELLSPREQGKIDYKQMIDQIVRERIAELMADAESAELEPFLRTQEVTNAMKRNQTVAQQHGWSYYYQDHSCLHCQKDDTPHHALGMCRNCFNLVRKRRAASIKLREAGPGREAAFRETVQAARKALLPSIAKLAQKRRGGQ